jgi:hypothetical protein
MKNIISNILGIIIVGLSIYGLLYLELTALKFGALAATGFALFYFENITIKKYLSKALDKLLK